MQLNNKTTILKKKLNLRDFIIIFGQLESRSHVFLLKESKLIELRLNEDKICIFVS